MALLNDSDMAVVTAENPGRRALDGKPSKATRGKIVGWSRKSRNRMQIRLNSLDWSPLFESGLEPALVTLTLPGDWETVAPTPAAYKTFIERLKLAYHRAWGAPLVGVWKQEFQRRGAPHTHILMTPPAGVARGHRDFEFDAWLSRTWADLVNHPDPDEYARHVAAGTGIDYVGEAYRDPRRIASYFGKHGTFTAKDYQNEMPRLWRDAIADGESGTQFWGVWRLKKAVGSVQLVDDAGSATVETILDPLGVVRAVRNIRNHYRRNDDGTWSLVEDDQQWASDASVGRAYQRSVDDAGSLSSDAVRVERHLKKLSRASAMRGQQLVRNKHGQLVLPRERIRKVDRTMYDYSTGELITRRSYRIGYYHGGGGYLLVHDGRTAGRDILRLLASRADFAPVA